MGSTVKNYSKEGQKLPMFGIGPFLIYGIAFLNAVVIILTSYVFKVGILEDIWVLIFRITGGIILVIGIIIWFIGAMRSSMDKNITENILKTDGIYSWVRNPMYTGCWFIIVGISFMWHNYWMIPMILVDWVILTIVLKNTEEKWLHDLYGKEYDEYKKRVNRCIPWVPKQKINLYHAGVTNSIGTKKTRISTLITIVIMMKTRFFLIFIFILRCRVWRRVEV